MRVAVVGAGAMGSIIGASLADGGADTTLVDVAAPLVEKINNQGVLIERGGAERTVHIPATAQPGSVGVVDAALFFVKCYHTEDAASFAAPLVGPDTVVATLQNGWGNGDVLARHFSPDRVVVGITYHSGTAVAPGHVRHTNTCDAPTLLGAYGGSDTGAEALAAAIRAGGLRADVFADIRTEIWKKLVLNSSALPTSTLTRFSAGALARHGPMMELVDGLIAETVAVGRAQGFAVDEQERRENVHAILTGAGDGRASMLQDIEAGRRTEIDVINGAVVRIGGQHAVDVPLNRAMLALVTGYEAANGIT
jgi:2-dehydropantoate 2-reductase